MKKSVLLALALIPTMGTAVYANDSVEFGNEVGVVENVEENVTPRLSEKNLRISLKKGVWTYVLDDDNWLDESIYVTNSLESPEPLSFRILEEKTDKLLLGPIKVIPGNTVKMGDIAADEGRWVLQAKADVAGTYVISAEDR